MIVRLILFVLGVFAVCAMWAFLDLMFWNLARKSKKWWQD